MLRAAIIIWQMKEFRSLHEKLDFGRTVVAEVIRHTYNDTTYWQQLEWFVEVFSFFFHLLLRNKGHFSYSK